MTMTLEIPVAEDSRATHAALRRVLAAAVTELTAAERKAQVASERACMARGNLPAGSSRARVTTANARWARAAEERDRVQEARQMAEEMLARAMREARG
jgi:sirohydrochlorin ferrochelatase